MKRILFGLLLWFVFVTPIAAQDIDEYRQSIDTYRTLYSDFEVKREAFKQTPTFTSEEELIVSAQRMLLARADAWITYWKLLSSKVNALPQIPQENMDKIQQGIASNISSLEEHKTTITKSSNSS